MMTASNDNQVTLIGAQLQRLTNRLQLTLHSGLCRTRSQALDVCC